MKVIVWIMPWEESERGWGVRPDGYSVHATEAGYDDYLSAYWKSMPDITPDEYSRPGKHKTKAVEIYANGKLHEALLAKSGTLRLFHGTEHTPEIEAALAGKLVEVQLKSPPKNHNVWL